MLEGCTCHHLYRPNQKYSMSHDKHLSVYTTLHVIHYVVYIAHITSIHTGQGGGIDVVGVHGECIEAQDKCYSQHVFTLNSRVDYKCYVVSNNI